MFNRNPDRGEDYETNGSEIDQAPIDLSIYG